MKKILFFLVSVLVFASCENFYIDQNLGGSDFNPTDTRTIDYTLSDGDYKSIVSNKNNIAIAEATLVADSLGVVDSIAYNAFFKIAEDLAFNTIATADVYVPALLADKYPQLSKGSLFNITYRNNEGKPAYLSTFAATTKYTLSIEDYETIWEGKTGINYLTPTTMQGLVSVLPTEAEEGAILAVVYDYKDSEPSFGGGEEEEGEGEGEGEGDGAQGFFDGTPESRGYYTPSEVMAAYAAGTLKEGDSLKVGGVINEWYSKSLNTTYGNLDYYIADPSGSQFEMWRSFSLNSAHWASYDYVDASTATATDANGYSITTGDTIIGIGAFKYYADYDVYEFNSGCYIVEHRPAVAPAAVAPAAVAPKKVAATNGKKTVLYQYSEGKWNTYKNADATVVALPEDVYSAVGYSYLLDKNKNVLTTFLAQEYPYAKVDDAYTVVYVATSDGAYNAMEFIYDGANFVENDGISLQTATFSLSDIWGSTIYYKQAIVGEGQGNLVIQNVETSGLDYIWIYDAKYGMKASAYANGTNNKSEAWVVTPAINLQRAKNPQLSFDQARKYGVDFLKECFVMASTDYAGDVTTCTWDSIPFNKDEEGNYIVPDGSSWTFMSTGELDLSMYVGGEVYIGFKYTSSELGSATWEFKNLLVAEPEE